jgi:diacylglycerol kinase family enzyme
MLNAVAIANRNSGAGSKLRNLELPFQTVFEPENVNWSECLAADLLVMFGGDGTIQHTTTALLTRPEVLAEPNTRLPVLAIVPYGTTNMSSRTFNRSHSRHRVQENLKILLKAEGPAALTTHCQPILKIVAGTKVQYGYAFGVGVIANFVQNWRAKRGQTTAINQLRSLSSLLRGLRGADECTRVTVNSQPIDIYALVLTTLRELIYGTRPFWNGAEADDAGVRATWIESGAPGLFGLAPALLRGAPRMQEIKGYNSRPFTDLNLTCEGPLILDGEVYDYRNEVLNVSSDNRLHWVAL